MHLNIHNLKINLIWTLFLNILQTQEICGRYDSVRVCE